MRVNTEDFEKTFAIRRILHQNIGRIGSLLNESQLKLFKCVLIDFPILHDNLYVVPICNHFNIFKRISVNN